MIHKSQRKTRFPSDNNDKSYAWEVFMGLLIKMKTVHCLYVLSLAASFPKVNDNVYGRKVNALIIFGVSQF